MTLLTLGIFLKRHLRPVLARIPTKGLLPLRLGLVQGRLVRSRIELCDGLFECQLSYRGCHNTKITRS